jgi:Domain of unknown function (DUF932)
MPHNIFAEKFYSLREPAWHRLGIVSTEEHSAVEVARQVELPEVYRMAMYLQGVAHQVPVQGHHAIVGLRSGQHAGGQDVNGKTLYTYGVVGAQYEIITHARFCELWDEATNRAPVETLGLLGIGERMFVTVTLPSFDVRGDEMKNYLLGVNPLDGRTAVTARTTTVRVRCANTLSMALHGKTAHEFRGIHYAGVEERLRRWLTDLWAVQAQTVELLREAYTAMADCRCTAGRCEKILEAVYPYPSQPEGLTGEVMAEAIATWEADCQREAAHRQGAIQLITDSPHGSVATDGTLWGTYQGIVEYEDYGRARTTAMSVMFGAGAQRKRVAFDACMAVLGR